MIFANDFYWMGCDISLMLLWQKLISCLCLKQNKIPKKMMEQTWDVEILQKVRENTQIEISRLFLVRFWKFKFLLVPYEMAHVVIWYILMVDVQILLLFYQFHLHYGNYENLLSLSPKKNFVKLISLVKTLLSRNFFLKKGAVACTVCKFI